MDKTSLITFLQERGTTSRISNVSLGFPSISFDALLFIATAGLMLPPRCFGLRRGFLSEALIDDLYATMERLDKVGV